MKRKEQKKDEEGKSDPPKKTELDFKPLGDNIDTEYLRRMSEKDNLSDLSKWIQDHHGKPCM